LREFEATASLRSTGQKMVGWAAEANEAGHDIGSCSRGPRVKSMEQPEFCCLTFPFPTHGAWFCRLSLFPLATTAGQLSFLQDYSESRLALPDLLANAGDKMNGATDAQGAGWVSNDVNENESKQPAQAAVTRLTEARRQKAKRAKGTGTARQYLRTRREKREEGKDGSGREAGFWG
jgi:hypothetical protein